MTVIKRFNNAFGTTTDSPLGSTATTMNSSELPRLGVVDSANNEIARLTLDPERNDGAPEIIHVTSYDGTATSATIERGKEGTTAREHASGTTWEHAPTVEDIDLALSDDFALDGDAPSNYPTGHSTFTDAQGSFPAGAGGIVETVNHAHAHARQFNWIGGTNTIYTRVATDSTAWDPWLRTNHLPVARIYWADSGGNGQSIPSATPTKIEFDSTDYDRGGLVDLSNNQLVLDSGLWIVTSLLSLDGVGTYGQNRLELATVEVHRTSYTNSDSTAFTSMPASTMIAATSGDALEMFGYQDSNDSVAVQPDSAWTYLAAALLEESP